MMFNDVLSVFQKSLRCTRRKNLDDFDILFPIKLP